MNGVFAGLFAVLSFAPALLDAAASPSAPAAEGMPIQERLRAQKLARLLISAERTKDAQDWILRHLKIDTDRAGWILLLARVYSIQRRHQDALALYREILEIRGEDLGILQEVGSQAREAEEFDLALQSYLKMRELSAEPMTAYSLAQVYRAKGDKAESMRWAHRALEEFDGGITAEDRRAVLRLKSQLGWSDSLEEEFGRLFDDNPKESEILVDWSSALMGAGLLAAALEPLTLLRERFPSEEVRWRELEAERLENLPDFEKLKPFLEESLANFPDTPPFLLGYGRLLRDDKDWLCAETYFNKLLPDPRYGRYAQQQLLDVRNAGHPHIGPTLFGHRSKSAQYFQSGVSYHGLPRRGIRVEAAAAKGSYQDRSSGVSNGLAGGNVSAALDRRRWEAGLIGDVWTGGGQTLAAPGVFGEYRPEETWSVEGSAWLGKRWTDYAAALVAGGKRDMATLTVHWRPAARLRLSAEGRHTRMTVSNGGRASQNRVKPSVTLNLRNSPFGVDLNYKYLHTDATSDAGFRSLLSISEQGRTHYLTLSVGRHWRAGRLRTDAFVFNGHEPNKGQHFGTDDLLGYGFNAVLFTDRLRWSAGFEQTHEDDLGSGDTVRAIRAAVQWRWAPGSAACKRQGA